MNLSELVYELTQKFPKTEQYGLTSQMRRAAVSVASNIAEGSQRSTRNDFAHFLLIAKGSLAELETQSLLSLRLTYLTQAECNKILSIAEELSRMLYTFRSKLVTRAS